VEQKIYSKYIYDYIVIVQLEEEVWIRRRNIS